MNAPTLRPIHAPRLLATALFLAVFLACLPDRAHAQIYPLCGDVDDDEAVTVTDGVQILRAAAALSSDCTDAVCDVDVSGTITVTDGVIILRKAAGLTITENCIPDDGRIDQQIAHLIRHTQPLISFALPTIVEHRTETADNSYFCDNGNEGTYDVSFLGQQDSSFTDCLLDNFLITGDVENASDNPLLSSFEILDVRLGGEESVGFEATNDSPLFSVNIEGGVTYSGRLDAVPSFEFFETSDFLFVLNSVQVEPTGFPKDGSVSFELTEESLVPNVRRIRIFYDGSNLARIEVTFTNADIKFYKFDLLFMNII